MMDALSGLTILAADAAEEAAEALPQADVGMGGWTIFGILLLVLVLPFVLGTLAARALKMQEFSFKMGFILFAAVLALYPFISRELRGPKVALDFAKVSVAEVEEFASDRKFDAFLPVGEEGKEGEEGEEGEESEKGSRSYNHEAWVKWLNETDEKPPEWIKLKEGGWQSAFRLGIDLDGGTNLIYEIDMAAAKAQEKAVDAATIDKMVGAIAKRINPSGTEEVTVRAVGTNRIEVIIPGEDMQTVEAKKDAMTRLGSLEFQILATTRDVRRHSKLIDRAQKPSEENSKKKTIVIDGQAVAAWKPVAKGEDLSSLAGSGVLTRDVPGEDGTGTTQEVLVVLSEENDQVSGRFLTRAAPTRDENGAPAVSFTFGSVGATRMGRLTRRHQAMQDNTPYHLAILLDDQIASAPALQAVIHGNGIITGKFDSAEVNSLVDVLNAGALEVPLIQTPISEFTQSPTLGADVTEKGRKAITIAAVAVFVFMLVYYRFAGVVADLCLLLNLILVLGLMAIIKAAFTLPGLAGLVLTIGMAVDANVLIFERIREEQNRGSSLRMSIQNGFGRAFTTIVDANVTTLIVAVVLYMIGTDQIRGFAVLLFIGIVMSMFSSLYFGRLVFDICERKRLIKNLNMMSIVKRTHWDFLGKEKIAATASVVLIVAGLASLFARGEDNLDIDFNGGAMVTLKFEDDRQPATVEAVHEIIAKQLDKGLTIEKLEMQAAGGAQLRYRVRTTNEDRADVGNKIALAFEDSEFELEKISVKFDSQPITTIAAGEEEDEVRFAGGHQIPMTFNSEVLPNVIKTSFENELKKTDKKREKKLYGSLGSRLDVLSFDKDGEPLKEGDRSASLVLQASKDILRGDLEKARKEVEKELASRPQFQDINTFDSSVAGEMKLSAVSAMFISLLAIVAYIWVRFQKITFGLAAVAALVHDVLCVVGLVALAALASGSSLGALLQLVDFKINLPMIAAFLTIVGYSLNDTIVVFDRIREVRGKNPALTNEMVNTSLNQTLARTLLTSLTTLIVVLILYIFGGEGIHGFAFALVMGVVVGTYSSIFVASPVLVWLMNRTAPADAR